MKSIVEGEAGESQEETQSTSKLWDEGHERIDVRLRLNRHLGGDEVEYEPEVSKVIQFKNQPLILLRAYLSRRGFCSQVTGPVPISPAMLNSWNGVITTHKRCLVLLEGVQITSLLINKKKNNFQSAGFFEICKM